MIQIAFQPALDPYHSIFRLLRLIPVIRACDRLEVNHVRILDFYIAFPFRISSIRVKSPHRRFKALGSRYSNTKPYGDTPDDRTLFARMAPIQETAMQSLAEHGYLLGPELDAGWFTPTDALPPAELADRIEEVNGRDQDLMEFVGVLATEYNLLGRDGLKDRTGLLEYRYDPV